MSAGSTKRLMAWFSMASCFSWSAERPETLALPSKTPCRRGPSTAPGWIELAVMPNSPSSKERVLVKPTRPHLVVE